MSEHNNATTVTAAHDMPHVKPQASGFSGADASNSHQYKPEEVFENYILKCPLGERGGQGEVWKAVHTSKLEGPFVALKIYSGTSEPTRKWWGRERDALGHMTAGMPRAVASGLDKNGRPYLVMEYIAGETIVSFAQRFKLSLAERLGLVISVTEHIQEAHAVGLVHRDIRASNLLVDGQHSPPVTRIIDWGLATNMDCGEIAADGATIAGQLAGTPEYMAQEVLEEGLIRASIASDVLALGIVLHELTTGVGLYDASPVDADQRFQRARQFWSAEQHPRPGERLRIAREKFGIDVMDGADIAGRSRWEAALRTDVGQVLRCATHEDISRRYKTAGELLHDLRLVKDRLATAKSSCDQGKLRCQQLLGSGDHWLRAAYFQRVVHDAALLAGANALLRTSDHMRARHLLDLVSPASAASWAHRYLLRRAEPWLLAIEQEATPWTGKPKLPIAWTQGGLRFAAVRGNRVIVIDANTGHTTTLPNDARSIQATVASFSPDGERLLTANFFDPTVSVWDTTSGAELAVLRGHHDVVCSAAYSPDGTRIVTASDDRTARMWNASNGAELAVLRGHEARVQTAAFDPYGARIVTVSEDCTVRLWNASNGAELAVLRLADPEVLITPGFFSIVFSPDGSRLVTGVFWQNEARVWNTEDGAALATLKGHSSIRSIAFTPDGSRLITTCGDCTVRVWDVVNGVELAVLQGLGSDHGQHPDASVAVGSPDGDRIATIADDRTAVLWDARTGAALKELRGHTGKVCSVAFSPDGGRLATSSDDRTARIWDSSSGAELAVLSGHKGQVCFATFNPNGTQVITDDGQNIRLWDAAGRPAVDVLRGQADIFTAAFSRDGERIVTLSADRTAKVWDVATATALTSLGASVAKSGHPNELCVAFSPDGLRIVIADGHAARIWDIATGAELASLHEYKDEAFNAQVSSVAFSPDGWRVATASEDRTARVWDSVSGAELVVLRGHLGEVCSVAFSPDGTRIITASWDKTVRLWNASNGAELLVLREDFEVPFAALSPSNRLVLTAAGLWDATSGVKVFALGGNHFGRKPFGVFNPAGTRIAKTGGQLALLADAMTGETLAVLEGHEGSINTAAFSPDGARIITASEDRTSRVWDVASGAELLLLEGHEDGVHTAAFSPDGTRILTADSHSARIWDASPALQRFRERLTRHSSETELAAVHNLGGEAHTIVQRLRHAGMKDGDIIAQAQRENELKSGLLAAIRHHIMQHPCS